MTFCKPDLIDALNNTLWAKSLGAEHMARAQADARVARCLAALFNPYLNPEIGRNLQISQQEIGYLCSTSRQRANQALQVLEKAGLLRVDYGGITILDLERLRTFGA